MENRSSIFCTGAITSLLMTLAIAALFLLGEKTSAAQQLATKYLGGRSTPIQAIIKIAAADKVPLGIMLGIKPLLCEETITFSFENMTTLQALERAVQSTGYRLVTTHSGYEIVSPDLTKREEEVIAYRFEQFAAEPTTMSDLGTRLTGFIYDVVEGAGAFAIDSIGNTNDEIISIPMFRNLTAPQIADEIVSRGSHGVWIMQAIRADIGPKPGSTSLKIYSYHDAAALLSDVTCGTPIQ